MPENRKPDINEASGIAALVPQFYAIVKDFPDFRTEPGISPAALEAIEQKIDFKIDGQLREFFQCCAALSMNGLKINAAELGPIVMPGSDALVIGEFYLRNPGDRLLMLPLDSSIYYLEQRNGAITKLAANLKEFFNVVLPNCM